MIGTSKVVRVRFSDDLYNQTKQIADDIGSTVSNVIKQSCKKHMDEVGAIGRLKKIISETGYEDITRVGLPFNNSFLLYIRDKARAELEQLSEKAQSEVMRFIRKNLEAKTLLEKGSVICNKDNIILFKINSINVYCTYNKYQLIVYLVEF